MTSMPVVGILMGSSSDRDVMAATADTLAALGIPYEQHVASAHRTPERVRKYAESAAGRGIQVIVCGAGMAAHLAGVVAAWTDLPVIGVPLGGGVGDGLDALLATAQMPAGVPVAAVAVGRAGARNAALLAARILALGDKELRANLTEHREKMAAEIAAQDPSLG